MLKNFRMKLTAQTSALLLATVAVVGACESSTGPHDHEEKVASVRLTIGTQVVTMTNGTPPAAPIVVPVGSTPVTAVFLAADGDEIELHANEFQLRIESTNSATLTFTRTGAFAGTLNGLAAGSSVMKVQLFHIGEDHADFEVTTIPVTVQ